MKCPRCLYSLSEVVLHGQTVDRCCECCGIWFDSPELRYALEAITVVDESELWPLVEAIVICCPGCRSEMKRLNYAYDSGVMIDRCSGCGGIWLDAGELTQIAAHRIGTPAINRLCTAIGAEIRRKNRWKLVRRATRSRWASSCVVAGYVGSAVWRIGIIEGSLLVTPGLFCLPTFIWYPDACGRHTGKGFWPFFFDGGYTVTRESPGDGVAVAAWLVLLSPLWGKLLACLCLT